MGDTQGRVTLWGIEVFLATAEEGAISAAARRLGASPSAVSQQLSGLEAALGVTLLDRGARPMRMTPAGTMFRRHAQTILNSATEARAELAMADMSSLTTLRLGMIEDFDADVTPRLLSALAGDLRGCRFLLETGASHRLLDQLDARALDMVVAADLGADVAADPGGNGEWMEVHPLLCEPFVVAAPRGAVQGDPAQALQRLPLILYSARHHMGRQIAAHLARQNLRLDHRFELDSYHAIMAMVAGGEGWTILTPLGIQAAQRFEGAADVLPLPFAPLDRTISLTARAGMLRDMPGQVATRLRGLLQERVVAPSVLALPWLKDRLRVL
ncbi:LysR family transcriptional regulator [Paracoccaceae bacterium Fryx2]|nr:LysR family transcriptional regulator [Paracoccaceae bacterium Fryx2]